MKFMVRCLECHVDKLQNAKVKDGCLVILNQKRTFKFKIEEAVQSFCVINENREITIINKETSINYKRN